MTEIELRGNAYLNSTLHQTNLKHDKEIMKTREEFVNKFNVDKLSKITLEEYAQGTEKYKDSFCYIMEWTLDSLGSIRGSFAGAKFGIYFSEKENKYITPIKKWGSEPEDVIIKIREALVSLLEAGAKGDLEALKENKLSNMFKSKIYYVYFPNKALPIYSEGHINYFIRALGIECDLDSASTFEKRNEIIKWKNSSKVFAQFSNLDLMHFLYSPYGFRKEIDTLLVIGSLENKDCTVELITADYFENRETSPSKASGKKVDYNEINNKKSAVGAKGEEIVLKFERDNNKKYSKQIKRVSLKDDSLGYDIISYELDGREKHIEVKTKVDGRLDKIDFYLTANEMDKLENDAQFMIYYVCGINTKARKIIVIKNSQLKKVNFKPELYKVNARAIIEKE